MAPSRAGAAAAAPCRWRLEDLDHGGRRRVRSGGGGGACTRGGGPRLEGSCVRAEASSSTARAARAGRVRSWVASCAASGMRRPPVLEYLDRLNKETRQARAGRSCRLAGGDGAKRTAGVEEGTLPCPLMRYAKGRPIGPALAALRHPDAYARRDAAALRRPRRPIRGINLLFVKDSLVRYGRSMAHAPHSVNRHVRPI